MTPSHTRSSRSSSTRSRSTRRRTTPSSSFHSPDPNNPSNSDADHWFVDDTKRLSFLAAHEFGHMIGLEDEYSRGHEDFSRVVGAQPPGTPMVNAGTPAIQLHAALFMPADTDGIPLLGPIIDLFRTPTEENRAEAARKVVDNWKLKTDRRGAFDVASVYDTAFGTTVGRPDLITAIKQQDSPPDRHDEFIKVFTFDTGSVMGRPSTMFADVDGSLHSHPGQPPPRPAVREVRRGLQGRDLGRETGLLIVRRLRTGGFPPSANEKVVTVDDGRLAVWRSTGVQVAGSFIGQLEADESESIQALARHCVETGDIQRPPPPDAAIDTVMLEGARAEVRRRDRPEGAWGELLDVLRPLLERTDQPYAAIGLNVAPGGDRGELRHLGEDPIRVDLSSLRVDGAPATTGEAAGVVEAGPGWIHDIVLTGDSDQRAGNVTARVSLVDFDREHPVEAELRASSDRPLPST